MSSRQGSQQSDEFSECGESDNISTNSKFRRMSSRQGSQQSDEFGECDEYGESVDISPNSKFRRMSSRQGSQQSDEFGEYGEISPNPKIQAIELETRVLTKWMEAKGSSPTPSLRKH